MSTSFRDRLRGSSRLLIKEIAAFGFIGAISFVIEFGLFNLILTAEHIGPLKAKLVATVVATTFAYFGNRYWSFSHRARTTLGRETSFFFGINAIALVFSELILALFSYPLHYRDNHLVINIVNLATIGLGTVFRFWAYKRFVFLHPDRAAALSVDGAPSADSLRNAS
ncbi:MAG: rane protein-like protein [Frankiales bacterium]|nr:rane protein-like protein [Frankiales bacterium]